ncbi:hypothetical protein BCR43DRAFT_486237 [Syncephalastrum racemosum]|uniref:Chitobiosyldiphosphodolichol beta-mannosyltransferase n=1 Tax=Syncephalastrum racemosum TaxID=13706 RepID=A0A1X2HNQ8_SYNRA|nr:hypothetical protein BCR43DRAFT_486237 [Syncephalastrum racemosum]
MESDATDGGLSMGGVLLAVFCLYLLGSRVARLYMFEQTGSLGRRARPVVQVVVLGDIGRSPRIRYHAASLADAGCTVDLIGYTDTPVGSRISAHRYIRVRPIYSAYSVPEGCPRLLYLLWAPFKAIFIATQLIWIMGCITLRPHYIFIQNPPAIPTLAIARLVSSLRQASLVIDWHNFGYSMLAMKLGDQNKIVRWAKIYEQWMGHRAYVHLTVTDRMHHELQTWNIRGTVVTFKDRPQYHFRRLSIAQIHEFLGRFRLDDLVRKETTDASYFLGPLEAPTQTLLTGSATEFRPDRPRLVVSSTSWTEDEDFGILLRAIELYEARAAASDPRLLFVITGKGPQKEMYEEKISRMHLQKTRVITAWLETADYPLLLGSADLGISLHTSTSGMDLPMKVVDMFGCGLPVCAVNFECLDELVAHGKNGLVFDRSEELADQLLELFVRNPQKLEELQANVIEEYENQKWETQWNEIMKPFVIKE